MYYQAPGHQHVKVVVPRAHRPDIPHARAAHALPPSPMAPLVRQALDASFGQRDPESLTGALFDLAVRSHVRSRYRFSDAKGKVTVTSCHARERGEYFGTVEVGGKPYGYAARIRAGRLISFKVL
ncbi:hypothetical protein V6D40_02190 [Corynebacterium sp. Q4381]|uniref:hypothetical protein n=1 Tax=Corynebacterium sp. Marseille-Q4381 TaxID=3121597 RepID=UPI002FE66553